MDDLKIRKRANEIATNLNSKYPGIIHEDVVNLFLSDLYNSELSDVEINEKIDAAVERVVKSYTDRKNKRRDKKEERHYDLNDMFDCRITDNTLHIHVVPKSVKDEIKELGLKNFLDISEKNLFDAFNKIADIIQLDENLGIQNIFAVSPLLKVGAVQDLFRKYNFEVGMTKNEKFMKMFGTKRVGEAIISRENFILMLDERNRNNSMEKEVINDDALELERMVSESNESKSNEQEVVAEKTDNKVYVKIANNSEGGYGSVVGVVFVIISVSFILSGLMLGLLG